MPMHGVHGLKVLGSSQKSQGSCLREIKNGFQRLKGGERMKRLIIVILSVFTIFGLTFIFTAPSQAVGNMKLFLQWAQSNPGDWVLSDAGKWATSLTKSDPVGDTLNDITRGDALLNNQPGWVFAINVQGLEFAWYDHYHINDLTDGSNGMVVTAWVDDLSTATGYQFRRADVSTFLPLAFDPRVGGTNTVQSFILYREGTEYDNRLAQGMPENTTLRQYSDFVVPTSNVKNGIYVSDVKWNEHVAARTQKGWRDWLVN